MIKHPLSQPTTAQRLCAENKQAALITKGEIYLITLNRITLSQIMNDIVEKKYGRTSFSSGGGACQVREWEQ